MVEKVNYRYGTELLTNKEFAFPLRQRQFAKKTYEEQIILLLITSRNLVVGLKSFKNDKLKSKMLRLTPSIN